MIRIAMTNLIQQSPLPYGRRFVTECEGVRARNRARQQRNLQEPLFDVLVTQRRELKLDHVLAYCDQEQIMHVALDAASFSRNTVLSRG